ncbi:MAG: dTDP-4-amino-4,6-dideoxygalactose transaminase [Planctomycetota bacterium]|jgi:dTDP-4-amino-4,6-dideoxygalactose transaminase
MTYEIPFNRPFLAGNELNYIAQAVCSGKISGDGVFTKKCNEFLEKRLGTRKALLTTSGTAALEMAAILADIEPGDEVILPSFTFVSTANAFVLRGAKPVFVDIRPDTLNIDETKIECAVTKKTKAIVPIHYAGISADMDSINGLGKQFDLLVIEDNAQGLNGKYKGKYLGSIGQIGICSFHETKNVICGEGGAILLNDDRFIERAEIIREKGTNRNKFFRGEIDKYTWVDIGSSYLPSEVVSAFLYAQLERLDEINSKRRDIYSIYYDGLQYLEKAGMLRRPVIPEECTQSFHMFYILLEDDRTRSKLIETLRRNGILAVFHYVPLHTSPFGKRFGCEEGDLPVTEAISSRLLRLPFFFGLKSDEQERILEVIDVFFK